MAHRPEDKFVGAWFSPAQIKQIQTLSSLHAVSASELLRRLVNDATKRASVSIISANGHIAVPTK